jgi:uncharacterized protein YceK
MGKRLFVVLLAALPLSMVGCGTALNFMHGKGNTSAPREVYGGVRTDALLVSQFVGEAFHPDRLVGETPVDKATAALAGGAVNLGFAGLALVDLPFSAVADTATLPLTVPAAINRP